MNIDDVKCQLEQLTSSLVQVTLALKSLDSNDISSQNLLFNARSELLASIISLVQLAENEPAMQSSYCIGNIVLAPRLFNNQLCYDLGVILDSEEDEFNHSSNINNNSITENNNINLIISWLRPQSMYELFTEGTIFTNEQIKQNGIKLYNQQIKLLDNIRQGDAVLCRIDTRCSLWCEGMIVRFNDEMGSVDVKINNNHNSNYNQNEVFSVPFQISHICPYPKNLSTKRNDLETIHSEVTNIENNVLNNNNNNIFRSTSCSSNLASFDTILGLGEWEKHTKGVGGRLLLKMGYRRGSGLGRHGQGIAVPIPSTHSITTLGLSTEEGAKEKGVSGTGPQGEGIPKQKRPKATPLPAAPATTVFDFLNSGRILERSHRSAPPPVPSVAAMKAPRVVTENTKAYF